MLRHLAAQTKVPVVPISTLAGHEALTAIKARRGRSRG